MERTLAMVKPDAVQKRFVGKILERIEAEGFRILGLRLVRLTRREAEGFYAVHRDKPFFESLTRYMSSGPTVVLVLEHEDAIARWRRIMGGTDPAQAEPGTLRALFGESIERNAVHGSDAPETAAFEIGYFFSGTDLLPER